jgi:hypothetical protein
MKKLIIIISVGVMGCRSTRVPNIHTPTHREIKRAMKYSTSEFIVNPIKTRDVTVKDNN